MQLRAVVKLVKLSMTAHYVILALLSTLLTPTCRTSVVAFVRATLPQSINVAKQRLMQRRIGTLVLPTIPHLRLVVFVATLANAKLVLKVNCVVQWAVRNTSTLTRSLAKLLLVLATLPLLQLLQELARCMTRSRTKRSRTLRQMRVSSKEYTHGNVWSDRRFSWCRC